MPTEPRRSIPSVDRLLQECDAHGLPRPMLLAIIRKELAALRAEAKSETSEGRSSTAVAAADAPEARNTSAPRPRSGRAGPSPGRSDARDLHEEAVHRVRAAVETLAASRLIPVINATGVILHTNLGRAPHGAEMIENLREIAGDYANLEFDLRAGRRGQRGAFVEAALAALCGAESCAVVNNCAAALVLIVHALAAATGERDVVISRGELVQIGGGFRVPDMLAASGGALREIGTTNRTTIDDYRAAIDAKRPGIILTVHRSNFYMAGFVASPKAAEISKLARESGVPYVVDLGSGATFDTAALATGGDVPEAEPTIAQAIARDGADLICFSGDKLLGGPQAGIIAGRADLVAKLKRDPFYRALRPDRLILSALQTTALHHLRPEDDMKDGAIPILTMMRMPTEGLRVRAGQIAAILQGSGLQIAVAESKARVGGGSLPRTRIDSISLDVTSPKWSADWLAQRLRAWHVPIIARVERGRVRLDLRTVFQHHDGAILAALSAIAIEQSADSAPAGSPAPAPLKNLREADADLAGEDADD